MVENLEGHLRGIVDVDRPDVEDDRLVRRHAVPILRSVVNVMNGGPSLPFARSIRHLRYDVRVAISWGDGTSWNGKVLARGGGVYEILSHKRYARSGRYPVTVTWTDNDGRTSVARSRAVVARRR